ncbi:MAG: hypothetical protein ABI462_09760 [Ignavibacteria bacterium]
MRKKVLFVFDDPGGGLAVITLIERLSKEKDLELKVYAGKLNTEILKQKKIDFINIESMIKEGIAGKIFNDFNPDILISGTSGGNAEQELRNKAQEKSVKSVVILDFWKDYSRRWMYAAYEIEKLNDKVCVMDEETKKEMTEEKFNPARLIVTGNPYLDKLFNYDYDECDVNDDNENMTENNFLFLSQPLNIIGIKDYKIHPLEILLQSLSEFSKKQNHKINLNIRLHPLEKDSDEMNKLISNYDRDNLSVQISANDESLKDQIRRSEAVIGFNTIAMFESRAMGRRTISLNVVPVKNSLINAMLSAGIEIVSLEKDELLNCLSKKYTDKKKRNIFAGGIENCARVVLNELNLN